MSLFYAAQGVKSGLSPTHSISTAGQLFCYVENFLSALNVSFIVGHGGRLRERVVAQ